MAYLPRKRLSLAEATAELSRRGFLRSAGAGVALLALPACGAAAVGSHADGGGIDQARANDLAAGRDLAASPADLAVAPPDLSRRPDLVQTGCDALTSTATPPKGFVIDMAVLFLDVYVCRDAGGLFAMTSRCTHRNCDVDFVNAQSGFDCPCHGSTFSFVGKVTAGPAGSDLVHFEICVGKDGMVHFDQAKIVSAATRFKV